MSSTGGGVFYSICEGKVGATTAAANARYITRERATGCQQDRVWTQNVPEYAAHPDHLERGISYRERVADLREYVRQLEEDELERPQPGSGEKRTHYRAIYSFDREVTDEKAREMVSRHLEECFAQARFIAAIHRDTDNAHVQVHIIARQIDDKKIHLDRQTHERLDERWARIYGDEFGREIEQVHLEKKEEWREWKRSAWQAKERGDEIPARPKRTARLCNQVEERRRMQAAQYGLNYADETRIRSDQRQFIDRKRPTANKEPNAARAVERTDDDAAKRNHSIRANHDRGGPALQFTQAGDLERFGDAARASGDGAQTNDRTSGRGIKGTGRAAQTTRRSGTAEQTSDREVLRSHQPSEPSDSTSQSVSQQVFECSAQSIAHHSDEDGRSDVHEHHDSGAVDRLLRLMDVGPDPRVNRGRDEVANVNRSTGAGASEGDRTTGREQTERRRAGKWGDAYADDCGDDDQRHQHEFVTGAGEQHTIEQHCIIANKKGERSPQQSSLISPESPDPHVLIQEIVARANQFKQQQTKQEITAPVKEIMCGTLKSWAKIPPSPPMREAIAGDCRILKIADCSFRVENKLQAVAWRVWHSPVSEQILMNITAWHEKEHLKQSLLKVRTSNTSDERDDRNLRGAFNERNAQASDKDRRPNEDERSHLAEARRDRAAAAEETRSDNSRTAPVKSSPPPQPIQQPAEVTAEVPRPSATKEASRALGAERVAELELKHAGWEHESLLAQANVRRYPTFIQGRERRMSIADIEKAARNEARREAARYMNEQRAEAIASRDENFVSRESWQQVLAREQERALAKRVDLIEEIRAKHETAVARAETKIERAAVDYEAAKETADRVRSSYGDVPIIIEKEDFNHVEEQALTRRDSAVLKQLSISCREQEANTGVLFVRKDDHAARLAAHDRLAELRARSAQERLTQFEENDYRQKFRIEGFDKREFLALTRDSEDMRKVGERADYQWSEADVEAIDRQLRAARDYHSKQGERQSSGGDALLHWSSQQANPLNAAKYDLALLTDPIHALNLRLNPIEQFKNDPAIQTAVMLGRIVSGSQPPAEAAKAAEERLARLEEVREKVAEQVEARRTVLQAEAAQNEEMHKTLRATVIDEQAARDRIAWKMPEPVWREWEVKELFRHAATLQEPDVLAEAMRAEEKAHEAGWLKAERIPERAVAREQVAFARSLQDEMNVARMESPVGDGGLKTRDFVPVRIEGEDGEEKILSRRDAVTESPEVRARVEAELARQEERGREQLARSTAYHEAALAHAEAATEGRKDVAPQFTVAEHIETERFVADIPDDEIRRVWTEIAESALEEGRVIGREQGRSLARVPEQIAMTMDESSAPVRRAVDVNESVPSPLNMTTDPQASANSMSKLREMIAGWIEDANSQAGNVSSNAERDNEQQARAAIERSAYFTPLPPREYASYEECYAPRPAPYTVYQVEEETNMDFFKRRNEELRERVDAELAQEAAERQALGIPEPVVNNMNSIWFDPGWD
jgi:hypothetical protein